MRFSTNKTIPAVAGRQRPVGENGFALTLPAAGWCTGRPHRHWRHPGFRFRRGVDQTNTGSTLTINSPITGSGGVTIGGPNGTTVGSGSGTVILDNPSSYTGGTVLGGGVLQVGSGAVLGSGTVNLLNGTLQALAAATFNNAVAFNNSSVTIAGSNNLTLAGPITLTNTGMAANTFTNAVTVTNVRDDPLRCDQRGRARCSWRER